MSKKFNNKTLIIVLVVLGGLLALTELFHKTEKNIKTDIAKFKIDEVSKIEVTPKGKDQKMATVVKKGDNEWSVSNGDKNYKAGSDIVKEYLEELQKIKSQRLAAKSKDKWSEYQVTDSTATRVKILNEKNKVLLDILIGKLSYKQAQNPYGRNNVQGISYVRLANEKEVYAVDGFLPMSLNRNIDGWRDKTLSKLNKTDIKSIDFVYPDSSYTLTYSDSVWTSGNMPIDTKKVERYLSSLQNKKGYKFNNDFKPTSEPIYQLKMDGDNLTSVEIKCYKTEDGKFAIQSSQNTEAFFDSDENGLVKQLFKPLKDFLKDEN